MHPTHKENTVNEQLIVIHQVCSVFMHEGIEIFEHRTKASNGHYFLSLITINGQCLLTMGYPSELLQHNGVMGATPLEPDLGPLWLYRPPEAATITIVTSGGVGGVILAPQWGACL
jgi:hypothetical protein